MNVVVQLPMKPRNSEVAREAPLGECVSHAVRRYLSDLGPCEAKDLYQLFLDEIEQPLLREVMTWTEGNQSRAAQSLGLSRATLRKKLQRHGLL